jgi:hypothetical protein
MRESCVSQQKESEENVKKQINISESKREREENYSDVRRGSETRRLAASGFVCCVCVQERRTKRRRGEGTCIW